MIKASAQLPVVSDQKPGVRLTVPTFDARLIDRGSLRGAPWNARRTLESIGELADSIRTHGIQVPLIVRDLPESEWTSVEDVELRKLGSKLYQVVCGHRRLAAAIAAGLIAVPCIVQEMTDDQAREIGLVDNLQREDVPALEEADAYAELRQRLGSAAAIAQRVAKPVAYVAQRLQLVSLAEMPRKALAERLITIDHALLLARLGPDEQDANLKWTLDRNAGVKTTIDDVVAEAVKRRDKKDGGGWNTYWEPQTVKELKAHVEQNVGRKLSRAPWPLDDATLLQDVPACNACPSNTKHNDTLFGDLNIAAATCENGVCFDQKRAAFVQIRLAKAAVLPGDDPKGVGIPALRLSWKQTTVKPRVDAKTGEISVTQTFREGQWAQAKPKSCEHVRSGVTVDWSDEAHHGWGPGESKLRKPGEIVNVCIAEKCKVHKKSYGSEKRESSGLRNENSDAARADREKWAAEAKAENNARAELVRKALGGVKKIPPEILRRILIEVSRASWEIESLFPGIGKVLKSKPVDSAEFARAAVGLVFGGDECEFFVDEYNRENIDTGRKELVAVLKLLGYDASKAWDSPKAEKPAKPAVKKAAKKAAKKGGRK